MCVVITKDVGKFLTQKIMEIVGYVKMTLNNLIESCRYHPGEPYFHDAKKQWTCCKKYSTDFSDFLILEGCTVGPHNPDKPQAVEEPKPKVEVFFLQYIIF